MQFYSVLFHTFRCMFNDWHLFDHPFKDVGWQPKAHFKLKFQLESVLLALICFTLVARLFLFLFLFFYIYINIVFLQYCQYVINFKIQQGLD